MCALERPLTYDDLFEMPKDGLRREIIGGELIVNPAPRRDHQDVSSELHGLWYEYFRESGEGRVWSHPVDLYIGPNDVVQPDLIVIRSSRLAIYRPEGMVVEAPDIVIEIVSPSSQRTDRVGKMALYARFGVPEYWIVDPEERTLVINALNGLVYDQIPPVAEGTIGSRAFPGFAIDPDALFSVLDS